MFLNYFIVFMLMTGTFIFPAKSYPKSKSKLQGWVGTYMQKDEKGGLTIERDGKKLWIELWREFEPGEERMLDEKRHEEVYFASVHGDTANRLPFRGDICPNTFVLEASGLKLIDECKLGPPKLYYYKRIK